MTERKSTEDCVAGRFACPECGEDRMDELVIGRIDDDSITCQACQTTYWLEPKAVANA